MGTYYLSPFVVSGPGTYTVSWEMYEGYAADRLQWLYIEIDDAYADFMAQNYQVDDVVLYVDGKPIVLNQNCVWVYPSSVEGETNDYIIELYNENGVSGYYGSAAIGEEERDNFLCEKSIAVTFTVYDADDIRPHQAWLQFMDEDWSVGNWYLSSTQVNGPGSYCIEWDMDSDSYAGAYDGVTIDGVQWFYLEIDEAYEEFSSANYVVENVNVYINGVEVAVQEDNVRSAASVVEGSENDYYVELVNDYAGFTAEGLAPAVDRDVFGAEVRNIRVEFDVAPKEYKAYLQFMDAPGRVGNYPSEQLGLPGSFQMITSPDDNKEGIRTYSITWDKNAYFSEYFPGMGYETLAPDGVNWLYIEIDDAFSDFSNLGYTVSDVRVWTDGNESNALSIDQSFIHIYASILEEETDDFIIEIYNNNGLSGAGLGSALSETDVAGLTFRESVTVSFSLTDGPNKEAQTINSVGTGKWVTPADTEDYSAFNLMLEGYVTGNVFDVKQPSDVVMVLDQSASMYTPVGLPAYLWNYVLFNQYGNDFAGLERYTVFDNTEVDVENDLVLQGSGSKENGVQGGLMAMLTQKPSEVDDGTRMTYAEKFAELGYLVAQSRVPDNEFCTLEEHTHTELCGLCKQKAHTHTNACWDSACESESVAAYYTWVDVDDDGDGTVEKSIAPYTGWYNDNKSTVGLHIWLQNTGYGVYKVVKIADGVTGANAGFAKNYEAGDDCRFLTIVDADERNAAKSLRVGDLLSISYKKDLSGDDTPADQFGDAQEQKGNGSNVAIDRISHYMGYSYLDAGTTDTWYSRSDPDTDYTRLTDTVKAVSNGKRDYKDAQFAFWDTGDRSIDAESFIVFDFEETAALDTFLVFGLKGIDGIKAPKQMEVMYFDAAVNNWVSANVATVSYDYDDAYMMRIQLAAPVVATKFGIHVTGNGRFLCLDEVELSLTNRFNLVSAGAEYEVYGIPHEEQTYGDAGGELTDGVRSAHYPNQAAWSGWKKNDVSVVIDLGESKYHDTYRLYTMDGVWGIKTPKEMTISVSDDGITWKKIKTECVLDQVGSGAREGTQQSRCYALTAMASEYQHCRYVKLDIHLNSGAPLWLGEVEIAATVSGSFSLSYANMMGDEHLCWDECSTCGHVSHTHNVRCGYAYFGGYSCGVSTEHYCSVENGCELVCGEEQHIHFSDCIGGTAYGCDADSHEHDQDCFECADAHVHGESCGTSCGKTEHNHNGYGVACEETYDWFVCKYDPGEDGEVGVRFVNGCAAVDQDCDDIMYMYRVQHTSTAAKDADGVNGSSKFGDGENLVEVPLSQIDAGEFFFYKTQRGALLDAMAVLVNKLDDSGVRHRVAIVGFSAEQDYSFEQNAGHYTDGTGIYVGGTFVSALDGKVNVSASDYDATHETILAVMDGKINDTLCGAALVMMNSGDANGVDAGYDSIMKSVKAVKTDYFYTNHYAGMYLAKRILENNRAVLEEDKVDLDHDGIAETDSRQKVVILFTDGLAQAQVISGGDDSTNYPGVSYQQYTNDKTVSYAREMERTYDATVYVICTSTVNTNDLGNIKYLPYTSSNFPLAESVAEGDAHYAAGEIYEDKGGDEFTMTSDFSGLKYYNRVANSADLIDAFQNVYKDLGGTSSTLSTNASMQDILSSEFELPEEFWAELCAAANAGETAVFSTENPVYAEIINRYIKLYTVAAVDGTNGTPDTGDDQITFLAGNGLDFDPTQEGVERFEGGLVEVGRRADGRYYIRFDGFDYAGNYVSADGRSIDLDGDGVEEEFYGCKLVVTVPIRATAAALAIGGKRVVTNFDQRAIGSHSGIVSYEMINGQMANIKLEGSFAHPSVEIPSVVTVRKEVVDDSYTKAFSFDISYDRFAGYDLSTALSDSNEGEQKLGGNYLAAAAAEVSVVKSIENAQLSGADSFRLEGVLVGTVLTICERDCEDFLVTVTVNGVPLEAENGIFEVVVTPGMELVVTNTRKRADLTITKNGADEILDPGQTFLFSITGVPNSPTQDMKPLQVVVRGNGVVTVKDLVVGEYIVSEQDGWSWRYEVDAVENASEVSRDSGAYLTQVPVSGQSVIFQNKRTVDMWMDGNGYKQNLLKVEPMAVNLDGGEPKQKETLESDEDN